MKALALGMKGVVHTGCYVFHFGGGTFNFSPEIEHHKAKNYSLFMKKWRKDYELLIQRCENSKPIEIIANRVDILLSKKQKAIELDVLFYIPCVDQSIGGIHAVIGICNYLIRNGVKASCAVVGSELSINLESFKEPILFNILRYDSVDHFLSDQMVMPKIVFSTIFFSAPIVAEYSRARNSRSIQFIQGYECFFDNGVQYANAVDSYASTKQIVVTSDWLRDKVGQHLKVDQKLTKLPPIINTNIFYTSEGVRLTDVCIVLRSSPDKGQWLLIEILNRLKGRNIKVTVLYADSYANLTKKFGGEYHWVPLPIDQYSFAKILRDTKVFVDCSLHEGFGLMPLEAALCGCSVIASDSGGIGEYVNDFNITLVGLSTSPNEFLDEIDKKLLNFSTNIPKNIAYSDGELWLEYIKSVGASSNPRMLLRSNLPYSSYQRLSFRKKGYVYIHLQRLYTLIRPAIPYRIHLAIKVFLTGRI